MNNNSNAGMLYDRSASESSSTNDRNAKLVREMEANMAKNKSLADYNSGRDEGKIEGAEGVFNKFNELMDDLNRFNYESIAENYPVNDTASPYIAEGSHEDIQMQENIDKGLAYHQSGGMQQEQSGVDLRDNLNDYNTIPANQDILNEAIAGGWTSSEASIADQKDAIDKMLFDINIKNGKY